MMKIRFAHSGLLALAIINFRFLLAAPFNAHAAPPVPQMITHEDREIWSQTIKKSVMRPPCCGACPVFTMSDAKALWSYMTRDKTDEKGERLWKLHWKKLLKAFQKTSPERYQALYGSKGLDFEENTIERRNQR